MRGKGAACRAMAPIDPPPLLQANLNGQSCMDNSYDDFIAQLRVTANNPSVQGVGIRQWTWQVRALSLSLTRVAGAGALPGAVTSCRVALLPSADLH